MAIPIIQQNPATGVMRDLQALSSSRTQQRIAGMQNQRAQEMHDIAKPKEQMIADEYTSEQAQQTRLEMLRQKAAEAKEFTSSLQTKKRAKTAEADIAKAESDIKTAPVKAASEVAEAQASIITDTADSVAAATPETWASIAPIVATQLGVELTGDWQADAELRQNIIEQGVASLEHLRDLELQDAKNAGKSGSSGGKVVVKSPSTPDMQQATALFQYAANNDPAGRYQKLPEDSQNRFRANILAEAKLIQAQAEPAGGMAFTEAYEAALQQAYQDIVKVPGGAWFGLADSYDYVPGSGGITPPAGNQQELATGDSATRIKEFEKKYPSKDAIMGVVGTPGGPTVDEALQIIESNGW